MRLAPGEDTPEEFQEEHMLFAEDSQYYVCQLKSGPHDGRKVTHLSLPKGGVIVEKWPI